MALFGASGTFFVATVLLFGADRSCDGIFQTNSPDQVIQHIFDNWLSDRFDEISILALLALLTSLILQDLRHESWERNCLLLQAANKLATAAQDHDQNLMQNRPFIQ